MKAYIRILALLIFLESFACLGFLSSAQRVVPTQTADTPLYLNGEAVGSIADTKPLVKRLSSLDSAVDRNANLPGGGLPNIGRIILLPQDNLPIAGIGKIWDSIEDSFDYPRFQRVKIWNGDACGGKQSAPGGNGQVFVLSNAPMSKDELKKVSASERCSLPVEVYTSDTRSRYYTRLIKSYRLAYTSIEITESGSYILNEQAKNPVSRVSPIANLSNPTFGRRVDAAVVKQRPIAADSLEKEIRSWIDRRVEEGSNILLMDESDAVVLPIIANGKARYSALAEVLRMIHRPDVNLIIAVD